MLTSDSWSFRNPNRGFYDISHIGNAHMRSMYIDRVSIIILFDMDACAALHEAL